LNALQAALLESLSEEVSEMGVSSPCRESSFS